MEAPTPATVRGDFDGATRVLSGERWRFFRDDEAYRVAEGERVHDVVWTFGFEPLQQYLVPAGGGRLQALPVAWDARPAAEGGQRWMHLEPDAPLARDDPLHWTGLAGSWNAQCAECHATDLRRGYRPEDGTYATTFSDPDVACEACHGPGSRHVAWAEAGAGGDPRLAVSFGASARWRFVPGEPIARPAGASDPARVEVCAPCHSRRATLVEAPAPGVPFLDGHRPALLEEGLYFADGQMREEVYVWGSFVQSRMHAAGVVCGDCHEPHAPSIAEPDAVCASCHRSEAFAVREHHGHAPDGPGASCVACHMPARTYMVVDARRDHGFRAPRPDLTAAIGVPNACAECHPDRDAPWAAEAIAGWRGAPLDPADHPALALAAGRRRAPGASARLVALADDASRPSILRATALSLLPAPLDPRAASSVRRALSDDDPLLRLAAVEAVAGLPPEARFGALAPRLADPRRAVRVAAAAAVMDLPPSLRGPSPRLAPALAEYRTAQEIRADRPEAHVNLGNLALATGEPDAAQRAYERALAIAPWFVPARVNLADLERARGREDAAERVLREGLARVPDAADLHHALGLLLVRTDRREAALDALARAAALAPGNPRYAWVHGVALLSADRLGEARAVLEATHEAHPGHAPTLEALVGLHRRLGDAAAAQRYAERLAALATPRPARP